MIAAPTGSGKTLAAFLWGINQVMTEPVPDKQQRTRVLYLSPLRALANDINKNLRVPLEGITQSAKRLGVEVHIPSVGVRTGDTDPADRRRLIARPPDILITTPESLYLMLTSSARETLGNVRWVIVDEIHSVANNKRGAHLAVSLERLCLLTSQQAGVEPQRIGLSATQRPLSEIAEFLGGWASQNTKRPVEVVDLAGNTNLDVEVVLPDQDLGNLASVEAENATGVNSIWPLVHPKILELILAHRSTIVFVNARRLAERLANRLNEIYAGESSRGAENDGQTRPETDLVRAHHGSISREQRLEIENDLKSGVLRAIVSTSSLELGIDMGAVDLVIQVESPGSVASGLQRIGRAGHQVGAPSVGKIFPSHRNDLLEAAVVVQRMRSGEIEQTSYPRLPLDVLAQQVVAMCAVEDWDARELLTTLKRSAPYHGLTQPVFESVLDLLSGRYPSHEFAELRPRIVWDRAAGTLRGRQGAGRLAVTNAGTIADRGLYSVFTLDGSRVGELDEEMVYESRAGETFLLGASSWRIEEITPDRVLVSPAPGVPARMPFWKGGGPGRPLELGRAVGTFIRETLDELPTELPTGLEVGLTDDQLDDEPTSGPSSKLDSQTKSLLENLRLNNGLNRAAAANVLLFLDAQRAATGAVPDDRTVVVERFRDELGDWRVCVLTPFGAQVHAPWGIALQAQLEAELGGSVDLLWNDDGIVLRLPDTLDPDSLESGPLGSADPAQFVALDPDTVTDTIVEYLPSTALFAARFREVAGRALLLPRRRPGMRTPLWQQRQRAGGLLEVASKYPNFPMLLEAVRECLQDVFDVPALVDVLREIANRRLRLVSVETSAASPMAQGLLFDWTAVYMYSGDLPLAERQAAALSLNQELLSDLLGPEQLRELLDAEVLADLEQELQVVRCGDADQLHDELRRLGDLSRAEIDGSVDGVVGGAIGSAGDGAKLVTELLAARRACEINVAGQTRLIAAEHAANYRFGAGCEVPDDLPASFVEAVPGMDAVDHLAELVARFAGANGPFVSAMPAERLGVPSDQIEEALRRLEAAKRVQAGAFRPGGTATEWCDVKVLRTLRKRSLAKLRRQIKSLPAQTYGRFLPAWHGLDRPRAGQDALVDAINMLTGAPLVASSLEKDVLAARVRNYRSADLDELFASGELVWTGAGGLGARRHSGNGLGARDGRLRLYWRSDFGLLAPLTEDDGPQSDIHEALRNVLQQHGSAFWPDLIAAVVDVTGSFATEPALVALWDLVWSGEVTNDTLAPLRALLSGRPASGRSAIGKSATSRRSASSFHQRTRGGSTKSALPGGASARRRISHLPDAPRLRRRSLGSLSQTGPPAASGRWYLTSTLRGAHHAPSERAHAVALTLLDRHGILTRQGTLSEGQAGGFASVYSLLRALEERGGVRRGYFVEGLGGAQFASPEAVELLRSFRAEPHSGQTQASQTSRALVLASTDPAQPYGAALEWPASPGRPTRSAGTYVVLADGLPLVQLDRGGRGIQTFGGVDQSFSQDVRWITALQELLANGRLKQVELTKIDGQSATSHPLFGWLLENDFTQGYRGPVLRPSLK